MPQTTETETTQDARGRPSKAELDERERALEQRAQELAEREKELARRASGVNPDTGEKEIIHRRGCPENPERQELCYGWRPADPDKGIQGHETIVKRCMDCGKQVGIKGDVADEG